MPALLVALFNKVGNVFDTLKPVSIRAPHLVEVIDGKDGIVILNETLLQAVFLYIPRNQVLIRAIPRTDAPSNVATVFPILVRPTMQILKD